MPRFDLITLTFREPLRGRDSTPGYLPSDLLWGALYAADVRLQGRPMPVDRPYRVSSAFPLAGGEWLLPKPRATAPASGDLAEAGDKKAVRRLQYVNLADFLTLARGGRLDAPRLSAAVARQRRALLPVREDEPPLHATERDLRRTLKAGRHPQAPDEYARRQYASPLAELSPAEVTHLTRQARGRPAGGRAERQRNTQDRVTSATDTFVTGQVTQPRVAFLLETTDDHQRARLLAALRLLGDSGLGGLRSHASGQFACELGVVPADLRARLEAPGSPHVLLSLARPTPDEAARVDASEEARYTLVRRDGFLDGTTLQRQDVWMLAEGSVVPGPLNGTLPDVAPPGYAHPVYRSGLPLSLGVGA